MKKIAVLMLLFVVGPLFAEDTGRTVFLYYYAWYGNPDYDGKWLHWNEMGSRPPSDLSSAYFPRLGPYSSSDPWIVDRHMRWIAEMGVDVLVYSWWGKKDPTNEPVRRVLDSAADYGLKVSFMVEPYAKRTTASICNDIEYLNREYGSHPAFFRMSKKTGDTAPATQRGVFFIYQPEYFEPDLRSLSDNVHAASPDSILLLQSTDVDLLDNTHADGIFAYEAFQYVMHFYKGIVESVRARNKIFVPCVSPGFSMNRSVKQRTIPFRGRRSGETYDDWWKSTLAADAEFIGIISFNEWHEGTQIEPAIPVPQFPGRYNSYDKSYGKTGVGAETTYLQRTEKWIRIFQQLPP